MIRIFMGLLVTLVAMSAGSPGWAHHSFAATYDETKTQTIEGKIVQFLYRNPHSFVHVDAPMPKARSSAGRSNGAVPGSWADRGSAATR